MKVRDAMTAGVVTVRVSTPFKEVAETLLTYGVSGVPVLDWNGEVIGVVSESDLLAKEAYPSPPKARGLARMFVDEQSPAARKAAALTARDVMTSPAICVGPDQSLHEAARVMFEKGLKRLPVVEDGVPIGVLSRQDVLRVFSRSDDEIRRAVEEFLRNNLYMPPEHEIRVSVRDGVARLEGTVRFRSDVRVAGALVASVDGVVKVDARLAFKEEDPDRRSVRRIAAT